MVSIPLQAFQDMAKSGDFIVMDTETTGLKNVEIVQIAIISSAGDVMLNTLIQPLNPIPKAASAVHGLTDEHVKDAPTWNNVYFGVMRHMLHRQVVGYNAAFDRMALYDATRASRLKTVDWENGCNWWCAMHAFAQVYKEPTLTPGGYQWQSLSTAVDYYNGDKLDAHTALDDCLNTLQVVRGIAKENLS